jgi:hypothetical protein
MPITGLFSLALLFCSKTVESAELPLEQISNVSFWNTLAPDLHVYDAAFSNSVNFVNIDSDVANYLRNLITIEGYIQLDPLDFSPVSLEKMVEVVDKLHTLGLPLPFAYMYDEFWLVFIMMNNIIKEMVGGKYYRLPDFWSWRVDPKSEDRGWGLHRDKGFPVVGADGLPDSLTVWIPLTDATTLNGCMYMLPADRDPTYGIYNNPNLTAVSNLPMSALVGEFRALPALAGSVLMWNQQVWHYGSHASKRATAPRYSLAVEFQSDGIPPLNTPLFDPLSLPSFKDRLTLIAKQILQYQHMYALSPETSEFANNILRADGSVASPTP